jgi:hypothetical protein
MGCNKVTGLFPDVALGVIVVEYKSHSIDLEWWGILRE